MQNVITECKSYKLWESKRYNNKTIEIKQGGKERDVGRDLPVIIFFF